MTVPTVRVATAAVDLVRAAHPGPAAVVSAATAVLAHRQGLSARRTTDVTAAVLAGQLTIGWVNDLVDRSRDRRSGRADKPVASGRIGPGTVHGVLWPAAVACVLQSARLGPRSAAVHLLTGVGPAQAYNLGVKATGWSWLPFAVAFGMLPAVPSLAAPEPVWPPVSVMAAGGCLGVAAHLLNAVPDLDDDRAAGVVGAPHRLGEQGARRLAAALLGVASVAVLGGPGRPAGPVTAGSAVATLLLLFVAARGRGRTPFRAAMGLALLDAGLLLGTRRWDR